MQDRIISVYDHISLGNGLVRCSDDLVYQDDVNHTINYDQSYFDHYIELEDTDISKKLNKHRVNLTEKYCKCILDMGVGSGEFIRKSNIKVYGFDINPVAIDMLKSMDIFVDPYINIPSDVEGFSLWDTLEHITSPTLFLDKLRQGHYVFLSLPIFDKLDTLTYSKHFKPNEHYLYFTRHGLIRYMTDCGFVLIEDNDMEIQAGRENILSFVFIKL